MLDASAEQPLPGLDRLVEVGDRDPEVMDAADWLRPRAMLLLVAHGQDAHGADGLRGARLRLDVREQRLQLETVERLTLQ